MMKFKTIKKLTIGSLILFTGFKIGENYCLIKDNTNKLDNIKNTIEDIFNKDNFDKLFIYERQTEPSATRTKKIENIGKKIDNLLGNNDSWNKTSSPDTYGEAFSGVLDGFFTGQYVTEKPSNAEMIKYINDDYKEFKYNLDLVNNNKKLSYFENFDKATISLLTGDYKNIKLNNAFKILFKNYNFIKGDKIYHNKNIEFKSLDDITKEYFIEMLLNMDNELSKNSSNYNNNIKKLIKQQ